MAYREWGDPTNPRVLLCLHGLTRAGSDFEVLARAMRDRFRVVCPDIVGRGASDRLRVPALYGVPNHANDVATLLAVLNAETLEVLGSSMGGLIGIVLAGLPGSPIHRLLVNDIGPVVDPLGLRRIADYVGKDPRFATADEGVAYLNGLTQNFGPHTHEQLDALNRPLIRHYADGWGLGYDPGLAVSFKSVTPEGVAQGEKAMWHSWESVTAKVLITRGEHSDVLSREVMHDMLRRGKDVKAVELPDTGHAPAFLVQSQVAVARAFFTDP
jgi:pimeloyl-ACP methyl ester carboxylesterase